MRIRWTEPAVRDFSQICDYIEENDGPEAARQVAFAIYQKISSLTQFPQRGRHGRKPGTRELVLAGLPYLAVYRLHNDAIHGAQKWP
jgi:toxin ParE1/3/4